MLQPDEFKGTCGDFYKNMFVKCLAGHPTAADEIATLAELMLDEREVFITGLDFLNDGGTTASFFYGPLRPGAERATLNSIDGCNAS